MCPKKGQNHNTWLRVTRVFPHRLNFLVMRLLSFLGPVLAVASSVLLVRAAEETCTYLNLFRSFLSKFCPAEAAPTGAVLPDEGVKVTATFLESNPFGRE